MLLELQDGSGAGLMLGATKPVSGEVVFNTGMAGYVKALTAPSDRREHGTMQGWLYPSDMSAEQASRPLRRDA